MGEKEDINMTSIVLIQKETTFWDLYTKTVHARYDLYRENDEDQHTYRE